jgi:prepilin signal peptidase PulO-like enzyme (type II secretory pathway)
VSLSQVSPYLVAAAWALLGVGVGIAVRWASVRLARLEGLESGSRPWQVFGPPILSGILFGVFGWRLGAAPLLLVRSLWVAVLVQLLPAGICALLLSVVTPNLGWLAAILTGLGTGLVFLAIAALGALIFHAEAMGLGDVKFSAFMGLILGLRPTLAAVLLGVVLAGVVALALVMLRRRHLRDSIAYGPFLAVGALVALFGLGSG